MKTNRLILALLLPIFFVAIALGQTTKSTHEAALRHQSARAAEAAQARQARCLSAARQYGWATWQADPDGTVRVLYDVTPDGRPVYDISCNLPSAQLSRTDQLWPGGPANQSLDGAGQTLGMWDVGAMRGTHQEFGGRATVLNSLSTLSTHPTHVAGTLIGAGLDAQAKGMAPAAALRAFQSSSDGTQMPLEAAAGMRLSNHSYGSIAGWSWNGTLSRWEWYGRPQVSETQDPDFGYYSQRARAWDQVSYDAPYYLIVKAAGNDRNEGPAPGTLHYVNVNGQWVSSTTPRPKDGPYDCLPTYANAKNIITVGAVASGSNGPAETSFSGWGPTDDGRIKPDLVARGVGVWSAAHTYDQAYTQLSGTSMAAPAVTGSLALLQQQYAAAHNGAAPLSSALKGLALHTAQPLAGVVGPDYRYGWGLLDARRASDVLAQHGQGHVLTDFELAQGTQFRRVFTAEDSTALVLTLCWTDAPGQPLPVGTLNAPNPMLVNDLDVRVVGPDSTVYYPYILDPAHPAHPATTGDNFRDNVEKILIAQPAVGGQYTLVVSHKGSQLHGGGQVASLVISGTSALHEPAYCTPTVGTWPGVFSHGLALGQAPGNNGFDTGYEDFTSASLGEGRQGEAVTLYVRNGMAPARHRLWLDRNHNQLFDADEQLGQVALTDSGVVGSLVVNIPLHWPTGHHRVRLISSPLSAPAPTTCGDASAGEVEDYTLSVVSPVTYCPPVYLTGTRSGDFINGVWLEDIQHANSGARGGPAYHDYFQIMGTSLEAGQTYELTVQNGTYGGMYAHIVGWIDFNRNGVFETTERIGVTSGIPSMGIRQISFTVPTDATPGLTRLRLRQGWFILTDVVDPCGTFNFGEAEDYAITLLPAPPVATMLQGHVRAESGVPVSDVRIRIENDSLHWQAYTDNAGTFAAAVSAQPYVLTPTRPDSVVDVTGISVLDLSLIQRHVLGMEPLGSPYSIIAADVNQSQTVTTLDLALIRAVLLGNAVQFPGSEPWAFVSKDFVFVQPQQPFPFATSRTYHPGTAAAEQDFVAIKLGDVNASWAQGEQRPATADTVRFVPDFFPAPQQPGATWEMAVRVTDFNHINSYQFALDWDPAVLTWLGVESVALTGTYGLQQVAAGKLSTCWVHPQGQDVSLPDSSVAFVLRFRINATPATELIHPVALSHKFSPEAYDAQLFRREVTLGPAAALGQGVTSSAMVRAYVPSAHPNPFREGVWLQMPSPTGVAADLRIYNTLGQLVRAQSVSAAAGHLRYHWSGTDQRDVPVTRGVYYVHWHVGPRTFVQRLVRE